MILALSTSKILMMSIYFLIFFTHSDLLLNILFKSKNRFQKYFLLQLLFKKNESVRFKGYADSKYFYTVFLSILTRDRDRTVTVPWPYSDRTVTVFDYSFLTVHRSDSIVPRRSWPFLTVHRSWPFKSFYDRLWAFTIVLWAFSIVL